MEATISVSGGDTGAEVRSLLDWLRRDESLRGAVDLVPGTPSANQLGGLADTLAIAVGTEAVGVALAGALTVWLRSRTSDVTVRLKGPRGSIHLDVRRTRDADKIIGDLLRVINLQNRE